MSYHSMFMVSVLAFLFLIVFVVFRRKRSSETKREIFREATVAMVMLAVCFGVIALFIYFRENSFYIPQDLGQVGDFIGGLTNPILSFAALMVLVRSSAIQTQIIESQEDTQKLESFRSEFYMLLDNIYRSSARMNSEEGYVSNLLSSHRRERARLLNFSDDAHEEMAKNFVVESSRHKAFERFALSIRMAMHHVVLSNPKEKNRYALIIRDTMSDEERILFLNWAYYRWDHARDWFLGFEGGDRKWHDYEYLGGFQSEDFISNKVYDFFLNKKN